MFMRWHLDTDVLFFSVLQSCRSLDRRFLSCLLEFRVEYFKFIVKLTCECCLFPLKVRARVNMQLNNNFFFFPNDV